MWKDISPQPKTPFCKDLLWNRKKPVEISGYFGTQGYQHDQNLHEGKRKSAQIAAGKNETFIAGYNRIFLLLYFRIFLKDLKTVYYIDWQNSTYFWKYFDKKGYIKQTGL